MRQARASGFVILGAKEQRKILILSNKTLFDDGRRDTRRRILWRDDCGVGHARRLESGAGRLVFSYLCTKVPRNVLSKSCSGETEDHIALDFVAWWEKDRRRIVYFVILFVFNIARIVSRV